MKNLGASHLAMIEMMEPWLCFACNRQPLLQLQRVFKLFTTAEAAADEQLQAMVDQLCELETRISAVHLQLEDESVASKRQEIEEELKAPADAVDEEMGLYIKTCERRLVALENWRGRLQDCVEPLLKSKGITVADIYLELEQHAAQMDQDGDSASVWGGTYRPGWCVAIPMAAC